MTASIRVAAQGLTDVINANEGNWSVPFVACRDYAGRFDDVLEKMDELVVNVVPVEYGPLDHYDQSALQYQVAIDVGFRRRFGKASKDVDSGLIHIEKIDCLVDLIEEVHQHLLENMRLQLTDSIWWKPDLSSIEAFASPEALRNNSQYLGILREVFEVQVKR